MFKQIKQSQSMFEPKNKNIQSFAENVNISSSFSSEDLTDDKHSNSGIIIKRNIAVLYNIYLNFYLKFDIIADV